MRANRLRIHATQEWYDLYQKSSNDDLQKFFDRYLYSKPNDWEKTPRVRHSLLGFNGPSVVNRAEASYPPTYVQHRTFHLSGQRASLVDEREAHDESTSLQSTCSYQSDSWDDDGAHFVHKFTTYTELIGFSQLKVYMSCADTDDMDVYVILRKLDATGKPLMHVNVPLESLSSGTTDADVPDLNIFKYLGPNGKLRASHRATSHDPTLTRDQSMMLAPALAWHPHDEEDKITPGEIVCLEIPLWPSGIIFQPGESIRLEIKGHEVTLPEFPALVRAAKNINKGRHVIYTGPEYPSCVVLSLATGDHGM